MADVTTKHEPCPDCGYNGWGDDRFPCGNVEYHWLGNPVPMNPKGTSS